MCVKFDFQLVALNAVVSVSNDRPEIDDIRHKQPFPSVGRCRKAEAR